MTRKIIKTVAMLFTMYLIVIGVLWMPFNIELNQASIWQLAGQIMIVTFSLPALGVCGLMTLAIWFNRD